MCALSIKKRNIYLAIALCFLFILAILVSKITNRPAKLDLSHNKYPIPKRIQYSFTLHNKTNHSLKKAEFWTYAPVKQTSTQLCDSFEASYPYEVITDDLGNQILHFSFDSLSPYATKIITIKADLLLSNLSNPATERDLQRYLLPEKYIEVDNPDLKQFAKTLNASKPKNTAEEIFNWVSENVRYAGYLSNDRGALYALKEKKGDCTEYMYLFTALCRANKIPARGVGGYVCKENTVLKPSGYHNWAEFYEDGVWKIVDPQNKVFVKNQSDYVAMRVISESSANSIANFHRFRFSGDGLQVSMNN